MTRERTNLPMALSITRQLLTARLFFFWRRKKKDHLAQLKQVLLSPLRVPQPFLHEIYNFIPKMGHPRRLYSSQTTGNRLIGTLKNQPARGTKPGRWPADTSLRNPLQARVPNHPTSWFLPWEEFCRILIKGAVSFMLQLVPLRRKITAYASSHSLHSHFRSSIPVHDIPARHDAACVIWPKSSGRLHCSMILVGCVIHTIPPPTTATAHSTRSCNFQAQPHLG